MERHLYPAGPEANRRAVMEAFDDGSHTATTYEGSNKPFGQGDTPVALILQMMSRGKLNFPAVIELEYKVPQDSDAVTEVKRCVPFCKEALA